ncbi:MAG: ROK family protein [Bacteroidota bacterium]
MAKKYLGIDVGGTGIKGALVNIDSGKLVHDKIRILTPSPATPQSVAKAVKEIVNQVGIKDKMVGAGFPAIIKDGVSMSAANIDKSWIGTSVKKVFSKATNCKFIIANDADVAGVAEMRFGKGKGAKGTVIFLTLGTGIGSAVFNNGKLVPNTEFGHLKWGKGIAEHMVSYKVKKINNLSFKEWGKELNKFLQHIEFLFSPDLMILGGGGSKKFKEFSDMLDLKCKVTPAALLNDAGVIGAAALASEKDKS